jgi:hypothetical protein
MPLASPMAETFFELNQFYLRRAWGMTAKDAALPDSRVAGVTHALRRRKENAPRQRESEV